MSVIVRIVPDTVPVTLERPVRTRYITGTSWIRHPESAARTTISNGHPNLLSVIPSPRRPSRFAARMGPRSWMRTPQRLRTRRASSRLAMRAWTGQEPRCARLRPRVRSARPSATGSTTLGRSAPSSEPSASMKQTNSAVAAVSPAKQAAPKPRTGSCTTVAPRSAARSPEPSVEPLSTTMGRYPAGKDASTAGRAARSSSTGRITSGTGCSL